MNLTQLFVSKMLLFCRKISILLSVSDKRYKISCDTALTESFVKTYLKQLPTIYFYLQFLLDSFNTFGRSISKLFICEFLYLNLLHLFWEQQIMHSFHIIICLIQEICDYPTYYFVNLNYKWLPYEQHNFLSFNKF